MLKYYLWVVDFILYNIQFFLYVLQLIWSVIFQALDTSISNFKCFNAIPLCLSAADRMLIVTYTSWCYWQALNRGHYAAPLTLLHHPPPSLHWQPLLMPCYSEFSWNKALIVVKQCVKTHVFVWLPIHCSNICNAIRLYYMCSLCMRVCVCMQLLWLLRCI